jgi:PTS system mannose-specific IIA component
MRPVAIGPYDNMEERRADIIDAVRAVDRGQGVVILTDMFGGTPSNLAISVINQVNIEVIAGVNLPMLIKLAEVRDRMSLSEAALAAQDAGRRYIRVASVELAGGSS